MPSQSTSIKANPSEETIRVAGLTIRFLVSGEDSNGSAAAFEMIVPVAQGLPAPPHSHDSYEETIYGIEGLSTWIVDGNQVELQPGQALCIPRGAVHSFENRGTQDAKALCVITPAVIGPSYFREVAEVLRAAAGGPPDKVKMVEIMLRHGLKPAAPSS